MQYDLVFEGGGAKGMVFAGALQEFAARGHTPGRVLGTSAGAITALLLAAGYSASDMLDTLTETENGKPVFAGFLEDPPPFTHEEIRSGAIRELLRNIRFKFIPRGMEERMDDSIAQALADNSRSRHLVALVERGGWYAADRFVKWLCAKLDSGLRAGQPRNFSGMTLSQFYSATQTELAVVASDTTDGRILVLSHRTAPDCPIVWAVRMSMSIPLLWNEVVWESGWGKYLGRDIAGHVVVDGGVLSNFPIELYISSAPQVTRLMGPKGKQPVLGLLIDEKLSVSQQAAKGLLVEINIKPGELRTVKRLLRLIDTATSAHDKMVIEEYGHLVVRLPAGGYGTTEFDMTEGRRAALVAAGRNALSAYFDNPPSGLAPSGAKGISLALDSSAADRIATGLLTP